MIRNSATLSKYRNKSDYKKWTYSQDLHCEKQKKVNAKGYKISDMECMVFVVNLQNQHWLAIAVFPKLTKIEVFDPMGSADLEACYAIWFFLVKC